MYAVEFAKIVHYRFFDLVQRRFTNQQLDVAGGAKPEFNPRPVRGITYFRRDEEIERNRSSRKVFLRNLTVRKQA